MFIIPISSCVFLYLFSPSDDLFADLLYMCLNSKQVDVVFFKFYKAVSHLLNIPGKNNVILFTFKFSYVRRRRRLSGAVVSAITLQQKKS